MQRVAIVGSGGAGKTTFAAQLGSRVGLPVIHLDHHYWQPGWVETPIDTWRYRQVELLAGPPWIVDGNYGGTLDVRLSRADTVIVLSLPRWRCTLRRSLRHRGQAVQAPGCPERVDLEFLRWVWRYPLDSRPRLDAALGQYQDRLTVIELTSSARAEAYLSQLS